MVDDCFTEMISHWLKHSTSDHKSLKSKLVEALKSPVIDRLDIVKEIEAMQQTKLRWGLNTFGEHCMHLEDAIPCGSYGNWRGGGGC